MKKPLLAFLFFLLESTIGFSQTWTRMQSWGLDFEGIHWITDQKAIIVGENIIIRTSNGGNSWTESTQEINDWLLDVSFFDESRGIAVGKGGQILFTENGGETWVNSNSGVSENLNQIKFSTENIAFAAGENGILLTSSDFGKNWSPITSVPGFSFYGMSIVGPNTLFLVGSEGKLVLSTNLGSTWNTFQTSTTDTLFSVSGTNPEQMFVAGKNGFIEKFNASNTTFSPIQSFTSSDISTISIHPTNPNHIILGTKDGKGFQSKNGGVDFSSINYGTNLASKFNSSTFSVDGFQIVLVGNAGYIVKSTNQGNSWSVPFAGVKADFITMDLESATYLLLGGRAGEFFVTTNGATTLIPRPIPEVESIHSLEFWNTNYGFVTSSSGVVYRTSNAGQGWTKLQIPTTNAIKGVHIFLPEFPYVVGDAGTIARSSGSSGNSWEVFGSNVSQTSESINDISAFDLQTAYAVGDGGKILWSNNGSIWETIPSQTTENLNYTTRINGTTAYAVGDKGTALKTTDLGRTWSLQNTGIAENIYGVDFFGDNFGMAVGEKGLALATTDGGITWTKLATGTTRDLYAVMAFTENGAFAVGDDGTIIKYNCNPPTGRLSTISGPSQSCLSNQVYQISDLPEDGSSLIWRVDGGQIIKGQGTNQIEVQWNLPGKGGVFVNRSNFCGAGETSFLEVAIGDIPSLEEGIEGEGTVCQGESYSYKAPIIGNFIYTWNIQGGTIISDENQAEIEVIWDTEGLQSLSVRLDNECGNSTSKVFPVQVITSPQAPAPIIGESTPALSTQTYSTVNSPGLNYQWTLSSGGRILSGQGTAQIQVIWEQEGNHTLSVKAQNACDFGPSTILNVLVDIITSLEPLDNSNWKVYPNPSTGSITVAGKSLGNFEEVVIINSLGQILDSRKIRSNETSLTFDNLPQGVHLVHLQGRQGIITKKLWVR